MIQFGTAKRRARKRAKAGGRRVQFPLPKRLVVIGDLNGDDEALGCLARAMGLTDKHGRFTRSGVHLVQVGDVVNRGIGCRRALERLQRWQTEAATKGSRVTVLLGNHEAMVTLQNLAWCTAEEFLEFATVDERRAFERSRAEHTQRLLRLASDGERSGPIIGQLRAWEEANAPGRDAYNRAFGKDGAFGRFLRRLPIAVQVGPVVCVHAGLRPRYAGLGLRGLDDERQREWSAEPETAFGLPRGGVLQSDDGPLWDRTLAIGPERIARAELDDSLRALGAGCMVVGHTRTDHVEGGALGRPVARHDGRLFCVDVGIGLGGVPAALVVEKNGVFAFRLDEKKRRLGPLPVAPPSA